MIIPNTPASGQVDRADLLAIEVHYRLIKGHSVASITPLIRTAIADAVRDANQREWNEARCLCCGLCARGEVPTVDAIGIWRHGKNACYGALMCRAMLSRGIAIIPPAPIAQPEQENGE